MEFSSEEELDLSFKIKHFYKRLHDLANLHSTPPNIKSAIQKFATDYVAYLIAVSTGETNDIKKSTLQKEFSFLKDIALKNQKFDLSEKDYKKIATDIENNCEQLKKEWSSDLESFIHSLHEIEDIYNLEPKRNQGMIALKAAQVFLTNHQDKEALNYATKAYAHWESIPDQYRTHDDLRNLSNASLILATLHQTQGNFNKAEQYYKAALDALNFNPTSELESTQLIQDKEKIFNMMGTLLEKKREFEDTELIKSNTSEEKEEEIFSPDTLKQKVKDFKEAGKQQLEDKDFSSAISSFEKATKLLTKLKKIEIHDAEAIDKDIRNIRNLTKIATQNIQTKRETTLTKSNEEETPTTRPPSPPQFDSNPTISPARPTVNRPALKPIPSPGNSPFQSPSNSPFQSRKPLGTGFTQFQPIAKKEKEEVKEKDKSKEKSKAEEHSDTPKDTPKKDF